MFVIRLPVARCAAASSREAGGAEVSSTGGMRAIRQYYGACAELDRGSELAGYRIEAVERADTDAAVLLRARPHDRDVTLHVAADPPGELCTIRFLERVRRLESVDHPNLLAVYAVRTLEGRAVAVAEAPPGRRLDALLAEGRVGSAPAVRIARQVASAVDALEEAGRRAAAADRRAHLGRRGAATRTSTGSTRARLRPARLVLVGRARAA